jgi:cardiolipin synthase (CMP-forming)
MQGRIFTVPNQITLLRLGFLPLFLVSIAYDHYRWALLILVVAGLSDGVDGLLARSLNQSSSLGAYLDPIADKLLLSSSFVILAFKQQIDLWLMIFVLSRDVTILVVAVVILLMFGYRPFPPSIFGKLNTFFQIVMVFSVVLRAAYPQARLGMINHILMYTVATLTVVSALHYSFTVARNLSTSEK